MAETVGSLANEMLSALIKQFDKSEFEFFDFKSLDATMAVDKLGVVKKHGHGNEQAICAALNPVFNTHALADVALKEIRRITTENKPYPTMQVLSLLGY